MFDEIGPHGLFAPHRKRSHFGTRQEMVGETTEPFKPKRYLLLMLVILGGALILALLALLLRGLPARAASLPPELLILEPEPSITDARIQEVFESPYLYPVGTQLFYTNTMTETQAFLVSGRAHDSVSVTFSSAFGFTPTADASLPPFAAQYDVAPGATESGLITATAHDVTGNVAIQTYTYTLDPLAPTGAVTLAQGVEAVNALTTSLTLAATDANGSGVAQMCLRWDGDPCSPADWQAYTSTLTWSLQDADGEQTLHVRFRDHVGNVSAPITDAVFLDRVKPVVTVTSPAFLTDTTSFTLTWSANDPPPNAGLLPTYTVAYRERPSATWQILSPSTTLTEALFHGTLNQTYVFSVTTSDEAGNTGTGTSETRLGYHHVYLPLLMRNWVGWYSYDTYEPNDTPANAWGPLESGTVYADLYIWNSDDSDDYYYFEAAADGQVEVHLTNIPAAVADYDLYVYDYDGTQYNTVAYSNQVDTTTEQVTFDATAGTTYYVRVYPYRGFSNDQAYHLEATYPAQ